MRIATVLRNGKEYGPKHVERLHKQISEHVHGAEFVCLSDVEVPGRIPLKHDWPRWWPKLELCRPDVIGSGLLYFDLDTTIRGPLGAIAGVKDRTALRDFYFPERMQSSMMYITPDAAAVAWEAFTANPNKHMRECVTREKWGDQGFLESVWGKSVQKWQDVAPGAICSWKVHCKRGVPEGTSVIIFHGRPRPWEVE